MIKKIPKRLIIVRSDIDTKKTYEVADAIDTLSKTPHSLKFDPTIELSVKLGVDTQKIGISVRGTAVLPGGSGKTTSVAVICKDEEKIKEAKEAGADVVGGKDVIDEIKAGKINFKVCIATPDMMASIAPIARILGSKGLMPNPKLGTITTNIASTVKQFKSGKIEFKADKIGYIKVGVGKMSFSKENVFLNIKSVLAAINKTKPDTVKGKYLSLGDISYTMGPSLKISSDYINSVK